MNIEEPMDVISAASLEASRVETEQAEELERRRNVWREFVMKHGELIRQQLAESENTKEEDDG